MINGLKTLLETLGPAIKTVALAEDMPEKINEFAADQIPRCVLWYGQNIYGDSPSAMQVHQRIGKHCMVLLMCPTTDVDSLELVVVQKLLGYKKDAAHDGLVAVASKNHKVVGKFTARLIEFSSEAGAFQQY
jgi:hypothetical protein